jgi:hypothetical protein
MNKLEEIALFPVEIRYPEYFRVKATTVILYACGLISVDVKKYQQWQCGGVLRPWQVEAVQGEPRRRCSQSRRRPPLRQLWRHSGGSASFLPPFSLLLHPSPPLLWLDVWLVKPPVATGRMKRGQGTREGVLYLELTHGGPLPLFPFSLFSYSFSISKSYFYLHLGHLCMYTCVANIYTS